MTESENIVEVGDTFQNLSMSDRPGVASKIYIPEYDTLLNMIEASYDSFSNCNAALGEPLSDTIEKKMDTEVDVQTIYEDVLGEGSDQFPVLNRRFHTLYCHKFLCNPLPVGFYKMDASKTWIGYWIMNALILLKQELTQKEKEDCSKNLLHYYRNSFNNDSCGLTGFGGGEWQLPHLAASYAAVVSLALIQDEDSWTQLDTKRFKDWLLAMKNPDGSFSMHSGGESDTRAVYCALCIAALLNILDADLVKGVKEWLLKCQTFEGGFGGGPGDEAHGGYTYCALAALFILMSPQEILESGLRLDSLLKWCADRQFSLEGGFSGRTNKLVDGCYSHWVGGTAALLEILMNFNRPDQNTTFMPLVDRQRLQNYILCCCQDKFGLRDKPGCQADFYHTNYVLCGLSMCQHYQIYDPDLASKRGHAFGAYPVDITDENVVENKDVNSVAPLDAIFGLPYSYAYRMHDFYSL